MLKLSDLINESLSDSYRYRNTFRTVQTTKTDDETGEEYPAETFAPVQIIKFKTDKGIPYVWYAKQSRYDDTSWEIAFGVDKGENITGATELDIGLTGTGDAFKIFSTVIDIINSFIEFDDDYNEVQRLTLTSKGDNRTNLYLKRILPRIEKFQVTDVIKSGDESTIILTRMY